MPINARNLCAIIKVVFFVSFLHLFRNVQCANILAITPQPMLTHQTAFRPLWKELVKRGHNVTLLTTSPMNDKNLKNLTEIDASYCYAIRDKYNITKMSSDEAVSFLDIADAIINANNECFEAQLSSPEGQNLLHNPDNRYDLLFIEAQLSNMMGFSWKYKIPFIGISSLECHFMFHQEAGNQVHPISTPDINVPIEDMRNPSFKERLFSTIAIYLQIFLGKFVYGPPGHEILKKYFGDEVPSFDELRKNMVMLFVTTNPLFQAPRAVLPNTISLWQNLAMEEPKPLPKDLEAFISQAKHGLIYFSLGSAIDEDFISITSRNEILQAFGKLRYSFIWRNKDAKNRIRNVPKNVLIESKWLPQQDILRHPNTKLFITHAGINSLFEAAHFGVPTLAIPFFGDQHRNAAQIKNLGLGLKLDKRNLTKETITWAIEEIVNNKKYEVKAKEIQKIFNDIDEPPLEKAVWWTEYVLRNKNPSHLKNPANSFPWWQYYLLDVLGVIFSVVFISFYLVDKSFKIVYRGVTWLISGYRNNGGQELGKLDKKSHKKLEQKSD